ncbi:ComEC/Rec2 family competence protein [Petroclostridium sp. X23]|uniref:ComEC/Rec2 family competence protein n=1 Tax=Petroclostridium sp. X23 TaxID=3045146 RepID=UPI0024ACC131|nr:ComEC/Rec2 family competence protein [Petroclostridium sp. X23]WHH57432.1 ComEC/Rec2 family competence protein [Petroclostridium sp. X23]
MYKIRLQFIITLLIVFIVAFTGCTLEVDTSVQDDEKDLKVHFIDVGQADSILINLPGKVTMLIDAGNNGDKDTVIDYIKSQGIKQIDFLVGTHPHEDHIGGLDAVIKSVDIGKVYMPKVTHTSKTFKDVLLAIKEKDLKVSSPKPEEVIFDEDGLEIQFLAPVSTKYEELNNYSIVAKITYGETSFLLTGDAEELSEKEMLKKSPSLLTADVLKAGHHGSSSSTSPEFLKTVNPTYAVISVEEGNSYGHPHKEVIERLDKSGIKYYRTDKNGTIVMASDGKNINISVEKSQ